VISAFLVLNSLLRKYTLQLQATSNAEGKDADGRFLAAADFLDVYKSPENDRSLYFNTQK
jgi:hypothetical protein